MGKRKRLSKEELDALLPRIFAAADAPMLEMDLDLAEIDLDFDDLPAGGNPPPHSSPSTTTTPLPSLSGTHPILIRMPLSVIRSFKLESAKSCGHYQSLMVKTLRAAADGFV